MSLQNQSLISCTTCRLRKRKCDKSFPKCSLCTRKHLHCSYNPRARSSQRRNLNLLSNQGGISLPSPDSSSQSLCCAPAVEKKLENHEQRSSLQIIDFPSVFFLDSRISRKYQIEIPKSKLELPTYVSSILGDISRMQCTAERFFGTVHEWMPIISRKRFYEHLNPFYRLRADYALLILCMNLISWEPGSEIQDARTPTYLAAKRYYLDLEIAGALSIQALQAGVLIALFELGHAIYPSAFFTIATCVRYCSALGLDWTKAPPRKEPIHWVDAEEENRVWWAVVLLDRIVNVGKPERPLLIPDPGANVVLPGNDKEWDQGMMPSEPLCNVTTPSIELGDMGPFALIAHATRLLGQVLKHVSDPSRLDEEEAMLLDGTLRALYQVVIIEGQLRAVHMLNQQAICSIALIILHEAHTSLIGGTGTSVYFNEHHHSVKLISDITRSVGAVSHRIHQRSIKWCIIEASPFLITLLYQVASTSVRLHKEKQSSESLKNLELMKTALATFETKWKSAGEYVKVLKAREMAETDTLIGIYNKKEKV